MSLQRAIRQSDVGLEALLLVCALQLLFWASTHRYAGCGRNARKDRASDWYSM